MKKTLITIPIGVTALGLLGFTAIANAETPSSSNKASVVIDTTAPNDIEHPERVAPREVELTFRDGVVTLPARSLVIVEER